MTSLGDKLSNYDICDARLDPLFITFGFKIRFRLYISETIYSKSSSGKGTTYGSWSSLILSSA